MPPEGNPISGVNDSWIARINDDSPSADCSELNLFESVSFVSLDPTITIPDIDSIRARCHVNTVWIIWGDCNFPKLRDIDRVEGFRPDHSAID